MNTTTPTTSTMPHANSTLGAFFLSNPDALRVAWADLVAQHPHLHGPEVALRLGVPEAAMIAARIGHGAVELVPDLSAVLAHVGTWGKVLLAARNRLGVALMVMDDPVLQQEASSLTLHTAQHWARIAVSGVERCFLFEERDHHGHTFSINWFDAQGHVIGRVFLMSKSGREVALPHLHALALPQQNPLWQVGDVPLPSIVNWGGDTDSSTPLCDAGAATPRALAEVAVLACGRAPVMRVGLQGRGLAVRYHGPLHKTMQTPGAVHASDAACKLHLRMGAANAVSRLSSIDGAVALGVSDGEHGLLTLQAGHSPAESEAWLQAIFFMQKDALTQ